MAATYGYGGEFSSDEDIDRMEQQSELLVQSKFDSFAQVKPTRRQIEEAIDTIRSMPHDQDVTLTDELLAGLLDHFKTQRGPIVDSTRNLYKKIILRLIRSNVELQQPQQATANGDSLQLNKETNGNINNNNINLISKQRHQHQPAPELASSDEDEPVPPADKRKFDARVVYSSSVAEPMEIDSETSELAARASSNKSNDATDNSTSSEDLSETEDSDDESSDSEQLDITPIKPTQQTALSQVAKSSVAANLVSSIAKSAASSASSESVKKQLSTLAISKEQPSASETKIKKPYTRSQRIATRASSSSQAATTTAKANIAEMSSSEKIEATVGSRKDQHFLTKTKANRPARYRTGLIVSAVLVALIAFALFFFRSDLIKLIDQLFKKTIKF